LISVDDYIEQTALANPHVTLRYLAPKEDVRLFARVAHELPVESKEIKPHPYGVELGILLRMMKDTSSRTLASMLSNDFSRVSPAVAEQICKTAGVKAERTSWRRGCRRACPAISPRR
jgi:DNA topoisomerase-6 subunit B